jgi:hypothetical protein
MVGGIFAGSELVLLFKVLGGGGVVGELCASLSVEPMLTGELKSERLLTAHASVQGMLEGKLKTDCECC